MRPHKHLILFLTIINLLFYCRESEAVDKGIKMLVIPGGLTAEKLPEPGSRGARLYASYCSQCHNLPNPKMHSTDDWPIMFEKMTEHSRLMAGLNPDIKMLVPNEKAEIISYLTRNGFVALPGNAALLKGPDAFKIIWFCSVCHAIPDPKQFSPQEWSKIVDRMNDYRNKQGREEMTKSDRDAIINFLTKKLR